jgi:hypothetical protein
MKTCRFFKKLKIELSYEVAIPLLGIFVKECRAGSSRDTSTPRFVVALFTIV